VENNVPQRRPHVSIEIEAIENALAAVDAADESARIIALRAMFEPDLVEADLIRQNLAVIWFYLAERRKTLASRQ
jgi:hypothetical protein